VIASQEHAVVCSVLVRAWAPNSGKVTYHALNGVLELLPPGYFGHLVVCRGVQPGNAVFAHTWCIANRPPEVRGRACAGQTDPRRPGVGLAPGREACIVYRLGRRVFFSVFFLAANGRFAASFFF
jgi:hypothetical protein